MAEYCSNSIISLISIPQQENDESTEEEEDLPLEMFVEGDDNETDHDCQENFAFDEPSPLYEKRLLKDMLLGRDPLYAGSSITLLDAMCTLFVFFLTFHFSKAAFQKILDLLHVLLPDHHRSFFEPIFQRKRRKNYLS